MKRKQRNLKYWIGASALLLVTAGAAGTFLYKFNSSDAVVAQGNQAFAAQDYAGALEKYKQAQAAAPVFAEPFYDAANALYRQSDLEGAQALLEEALARSNDSIAELLHFNLGNVAFTAEQFEQAIERYQDALRLNPADGEAKYNLELALLQKQKQDEQKQDQQNQDQQDQQQQNQDQQNQQQQNQDQQKQDQKGQGDQNEQQEGEQGQDQQNQDQQKGQQDQDHQDQNQQNGQQGQDGQDQNQQNGQQDQDQQNQNQQDQNRQNGQQGQDQQDQNQPNGQQDQNQQSQDQQNGQPQQGQGQNAQPPSQQAGAAGQAQGRGDGSSSPFETGQEQGYGYVPGELTQEQAEQLLAAIGGSSQTLMEKLQEYLYVPGGEPDKDW